MNCRCQFVAMGVPPVDDDAEAISSPPGRNTVRPPFVRPAYPESQWRKKGEAEGGPLGRRMPTPLSADEQALGEVGRSTGGDNRTMHGLYLLTGACCPDSLHTLVMGTKS